MIRAFLRLFLQFLALFVLAFLLFVQVQVLNSRQAEIDSVLSQYQPITARIIHSEVRNKNPPGRKNRTRYFPLIKYRYAVGGRVYINDQYTAYFFYRHTHAEIQEIVWKFLEGSSVTVYFDPQKPADSVLVLPVSMEYRNDQIFYIAALGLLTICVGLRIIWSMRAMAKTRLEA